MTKNTKAIDNLIALGIVKNKSGIIKILQRNGITITTGDSDKKVTAAVIAGLKSPSFRKDLTDVLSKSALEHRSLLAQDVKFRAGGDRADADMLGGLSSGGSTTTTGTPGGTGSANSGTTRSGNFSNFLNQTILKPDTINQFISTGLNALNTNLAAKRESAAQKTLELQNAQTYYQQQAAAANAGMGSGNTVASKPNKGLIIGLSILGVAIIGIGIYFAVRKKK